MAIEKVVRLLENMTIPSAHAMLLIVTQYETNMV